MVKHYVFDPDSTGDDKILEMRPIVRVHRALSIIFLVCTSISYAMWLALALTVIVAIRLTIAS